MHGIAPVGDDHLVRLRMTPVVAVQSALPVHAGHGACQPQGDGILDFGYGGEDDTALGAEGAPPEAEVPETYLDVDVTEHVEDHTDYVGNQAVADDLAGAPPAADCAWYAFWCWLF